MMMTNSDYKIASIYFWSGTGNSYRVAAWMGSAAGKHGVTAEVLSIEKGHPHEDFRMKTGTLFAVVFPTHGFTAPWHMLKFACRLPAGRATDAVCVTTRAGLKFGPVFIPGISGTAPFIVALILLLKGYRVRGTMSVDMPSNWYSLHPIQSRRSHEAIGARAERKAARFMEAILSRRTVLFTLNNLYEIVWGILLSWLSAAYLCIGRFFLAKLFFANARCDGCGVCAHYCSLGAIVMRGGSDPKPYWKYNCESCMRCSAFCPRNAVEAGHSWGVLLYFITALPVSAYLASWTSGYFSGGNTIEGTWSGELIELVYLYPAMFISYALFNALMRIPAINWIFTHTTMTHLSFWGRYRETKVKLGDIAQYGWNTGDRKKS